MLLYLGLDPKGYQTEKTIIHFPVIQTRNIPFDHPKIAHAFSDLDEYTHLIFTSKSTVHYFFEALRFYGFSSDLNHKVIFSIGESTQNSLKKQGIESQLAKCATQEGVIAALAQIDFEKSYLFYPRSKIARSLLEHFLIKKEIRHQLCDLYETVPRLEKQNWNWEEIDEIVFTSPSTVNAFFNFYSLPPSGIALTSIGPVTKRALELRVGLG